MENTISVNRQTLQGASCPIGGGVLPLGVGQGAIGSLWAIYLNNDNIP